MEDVTLPYAKEHLEDLAARAAEGEDVLFSVPGAGRFRLVPVVDVPTLDLTAPRVTDTMPKFVPLKKPRKLGQLEGIIPPPPDGFFDPMNEEELKIWYGDDT
jgi:antitoxin (DNA-binding transcriptional repressor) of toxin-antitoxin stability system